MNMEQCELASKIHLGDTRFTARWKRLSVRSGQNLDAAFILFLFIFLLERSFYHKNHIFPRRGTSQMIQISNAQKAESRTLLLIMIFSHLLNGVYGNSFWRRRFSLSDSQHPLLLTSPARITAVHLLPLWAPCDDHSENSRVILTDLFPFRRNMIMREAPWFRCLVLGGEAEAEAAAAAAMVRPLLTKRQNWGLVMRNVEFEGGGVGDNVTELRSRAGMACEYSAVHLRIWLWPWPVNKK